jgi:RecB family exonuclease
MTGKQYYFPTTIDSYRNCPLSYWGYRNRKDLRSKFTVDEKAWIGKVVHYFMEMFFRTGPDKADRDMLMTKAWYGYLQRDMPADGFWGEDERLEKRAFKSTRVMIDSFLAEHPELLDMEYVGAEQWCHADYEQAPLGIRADLILRSKVDGHIHIIDWKTGKKPYHAGIEAYMRNVSQMPVSGLVAAWQFKDDAPTVSTFWLFVDYELTYTFAQADLDVWLIYYRQLITHIENDVEMGYREGGLCGWCDYHSICPAKGGSRT